MEYESRGDCEQPCLRPVGFCTQIRILKKKVQQIEGLEMRGAALDPQQLAKIAAKPLLESALVLLEQGTPLPEVQALLAAAKEGGAHHALTRAVPPLALGKMLSQWWHCHLQCSSQVVSTNLAWVVMCEHVLHHASLLCRRQPGSCPGQQLGQQPGHSRQGCVGRRQAGRADRQQQRGQAALWRWQAQAAQGALHGSHVRGLAYPTLMGQDPVGRSLPVELRLEVVCVAVSKCGCLDSIGPVWSCLRWLLRQVHWSLRRTCGVVFTEYCGCRGCRSQAHQGA